MVIGILYKNTRKKIKRSFGRFISLFMIALVGVGFFAGIQISAPDMTAMADQYYKTSNLMDFKVVSSMGLTEEDAAELKAIEGVQAVIPSYSLDVLSGEKSIRIHAIEETVNTPQIVEGRMPVHQTECLADRYSYRLGDIISITSEVEDRIQTTAFTVVGTIDSPLYLAADYGSSTMGDGKLSAYIFVPKDNFLSEVYTELYVTVKGAGDTTAYSASYEDLAEAVRDRLTALKPERENARYLEIYHKVRAELDTGREELHAEKVKGSTELGKAKKELDESAEKLQTARRELENNEAKLQKTIEKQTAEFRSARQRIAAAWSELNEALEQYGIKKDALPAKAEQLQRAIQEMQVQLEQLPESSPEYIQLSAAMKEYSLQQDGLLQLKRSIAELEAQEAALNQGIQTFETESSSAKKQLQAGKQELADSEKKLEDGYKKYGENLELFQKEIGEAESKLTEAEGELAQIQHPKWYLFGRDAAVGYELMGEGISLISSIAAVFPFFFILIAMLMTSNSMARMVVEERGELGTLTSLGYKDSQIISTYLLYVLSASGLGAAAGYFLGCSVIPPLIYAAFPFHLPPMSIQYDWLMFSVLAAVTVLLMGLVTVFACYKELKQNPSALMRPVPPKRGHKIFLERIGFLWNRLSFTWKVTIRNMLRYKKRGLMTIIGVSGCAALLLVGFGLQDSIDGVAERQYGEIFTYSQMITLKDEAEGLADLEPFLYQEGIRQPLLIWQSTVTCESEKDSIHTYFLVPQSKEIFYEYYHLLDAKSREALSLPDDGVILTKKLADIFQIKPGDRITVKDSNDKLYHLPVTSVAENYISNYIYISPVFYQELIGAATPVTYNTIVSAHSGENGDLAKNLMEQDGILNVISTEDLVRMVYDNNSSLDSVIVLVVAVAALLAFIVLYNLTSINISERTREIATLKVLGFYDSETNSYIYREAIILTVAGIGVGIVLGLLLHGFVVSSMETNASMFFKQVKWLSFVISGAATMLITLIMQLVTYFKLKTIDMVESLKSVE